MPSNVEHFVCPPEVFTDLPIVMLRSYVISGMSLWSILAVLLASLTVSDKRRLKILVPKRVPENDDVIRVASGSESHFYWQL